MSLFAFTLLSDVRSPCHLPDRTSYVWRHGKLFHNAPPQPAHSSTTTTFNLYRLCHVQAYVQCCLMLLVRKLVGIVHMIQWVLSFELSILVKY
jgi:hypothetical protein